MSTTKAHHFLIFGNGWISGHVQAAIASAGRTYTVSSARIENREAVLYDITQTNPTHVINTAGTRGDPNVDWCEIHKEQTTRSNIIGATNLADCCFLKGVHMTHLSSGCIYNYNESHGWGGPGYTEDEEPNFTRSFYSYTKIVAEKILKHYPNVLVLRIRNPIAGDLHAKNLIVKLSSYNKIVDVPNSGSILPSLLPGAVILADNHEVGIYNFTSPGTFTHNEIMALLKKHVWPSLSWDNFSEEEQNRILQAPRCHNELDITKLQSRLRQYGYELPKCHDAMEQAFKEIGRVE
ncbi:NAD(P)-binding protein [Aspergillus avenaceus]|uniref:NAD(P)-binding protein n=1 Tax=Aspergillus avenaceus TaxID=36643 RepID=A0A5N6TZC1_ASPAV|nr:NAD(P)-binding protein [Aspergillus avenaceus]